VSELGGDAAEHGGGLSGKNEPDEHSVRDEHAQPHGQDPRPGGQSQDVRDDAAAGSPAGCRGQLVDVLSVPLLTTLLLAVSLLTTLLLAVPLLTTLLLAVPLLTTLLLAVPLLTTLLLAVPLLTTLLLAVSLLTRGVETGLLVGVVPAGLIALKPWLLLGVEVLLVATALQLLRVHTQLLQHAGVLLRVHLVHALQLLGGLLVVTAELANEVHD